MPQRRDIPFNAPLVAFRWSAHRLHPAHRHEVIFGFVAPFHGLHAGLMASYELGVSGTCPVPSGFIM